MRIYNSITRQKETFRPLNKNSVTMYVCGPTVYDVGHLGHARSAVAFDVIRRYFMNRHRFINGIEGTEVTFVSNITDVDDKIIARAARENIGENALAEKIIPEYAKDYGALGILPPGKGEKYDSKYQPRCTHYIKEMVVLIERLVTMGHAYTTDDGVYFRVNNFKNYGILSGQNIDELQSGARIAIDEKKENPLDFALWKKKKPGEETAYWDGPCGIQGRPGWHIECSAMSGSIFGDVFDIHGGGIDLIFPHHEDEIAQSVASMHDERLRELHAQGRRGFAQYWMHNGHVRVNKEKMSKSLGNFFTIKEILARWHPAVVRYFLLSTHYRLPIEFSDMLLEQAKNSLERLRDCYRKIDQIIVKGDDMDDAVFDNKAFVQDARKKFSEGMDDDFEISRALGAIFDFLTEINRRLQQQKLNYRQAVIAKTFFEDVDSVLFIFKEEEIIIDREIEKLLEERKKARIEKNFTRSDEIRSQLDVLGIVIEDTPEGTVWKKKL